MSDTGKLQQRTLAWAASLALVISVVLVGFAPTASAKVEHCPDGGEKYEVSGSGGTTTMTVDGRTVEVVVSGANVTFYGADDKPLNVEYCLKAGTDNTGKENGTSGDTSSIPNNGGQTPAISYVKVYKVNTPPYVLKTETAQQQIEGQPNCQAGTVAVYDQERTRTETSEGVWGEWTSWATVNETSRSTTDQECPPYVLKTETAQQQIEGQPNCQAGTVAVYDQERTRTETSEGVWGEWTSWATVNETSRSTTDQECPPYVLGTEKQLRTVEGQPNCQLGTVAVYDQERTRGETSEGVWGEWTSWATVNETTRSTTDQECPPYVLGTEKQVRTVEGQPNCETGTVAVTSRSAPAARPPKASGASGPRGPPSNETTRSTTEQECPPVRAGHREAGAHGRGSAQLRDRHRRGH